MAESRSKSLRKRVLMLMLLLMATFMVISGLYRDHTDQAAVDRGMVEPGMGIPNLLPVVQ